MTNKTESGGRILANLGKVTTAMLGNCFFFAKVDVSARQHYQLRLELDTSPTINEMRRYVVLMIHC